MTNRGDGSGAAAAQSLDAVSGDTLRRLHRGVVTGEQAVRGLLEQARSSDCELQNGVDRRSDPRSARIVGVSGDRLTLRAPNIVAAGQPQIYLHFEIGASRYFFASPPIRGGGEELLDLQLPLAIYEAERRDLLRRSASEGNDPPRVRLRASGLDAAHGVEAHVRDWSYQGLGVVLPSGDAVGVDGELTVEFIEGARAGEQVYGGVRNRRTDPDRGDWTQLGLEVSSVEMSPPFPVERREKILDGGIGRRAWRRIALAGEMARALPLRVLRGQDLGSEESSELEVVAFANRAGREIRGLLDRAGSEPGGTAVVIPPAWGRTKETFLPLARTLVATFEALGEPLTVLRFDGTNRRGESWIDPACRAEGDEYLQFKFSQAVEDIESSIDYLEQRPDIAAKNVVLVTFSLGAIEGRRALVRDAGRRTAGWVSVVGMVDLQSGLRAVSGGVDYAYGQARGIEFGRHELVGVVADMDVTGRDAFEHDLVFLEDARRDMAALQIPVTWLHGRHDAWMDVERVRALLSAGAEADRKLIEIPAGHQMRSSKEALETFQLVSSEVARMALGRITEPALPDFAGLTRRSNAERARRPSPTLDAPAFWEDYLLGRDRRLGFELMSATTAYRDLMSVQIEQLEIAPGQRIVDLGSGTDGFSLELARRDLPGSVRVASLDLVPAALARGRHRMASLDPRGRIRVDHLAGDLELESGSIPLANESADSVLASLLLSYVKQPELLLRAMRDLLKPGGRLVVSSMRRDADISRIYVDAISELPPDRRLSHFGVDSDSFDDVQRVFLNDAARLLQLEEAGRFQFWDGEELAAICERAGFEPLSYELAFGDPPQAVVVTARRPLR